MATGGKSRPVKPALAKGAGAMPLRADRKDVRPAPDAKQFYTPGEVAALFGVTAKTVSNWCDQGRLASILTPAGHRRIPVTAIKGGREYDAKLQRLREKLDVINAAVPAGDAGAEGSDE